MNRLLATVPCTVALALLSSSPRGLGVPSRGAAEDGTFPPLPVHFSVAPSAGALGPDGSARRRPPAGPFIAAQLEAANHIFAPLGLRFEEDGRSVLPSEHAVLDTRRDRHALGPRVRPGVIHVFVVAFLRDVDDPTRARQGVHWTPRGEGGARGAHLVVLAGYAGPGILAHELGHYLGNRRHSDVPGNVMSYDWAGRTPVFDSAQRGRIHAFVRNALETGALRTEVGGDEP